MKIGIKLRCYPDSQLKQLIHQTAGNNRFIYNYFLNLKNIKYQENKTSLSYQDCSALLPSLKNSVFAFQRDSKEPIDFMTISGHDFNFLKNNSSKSQAELKNINNKKLPESSGEIKTVEMYKTNNIPSNIIGNINEAVNASL